MIYHTDHRTVADLYRIVDSVPGVHVLEATERGSKSRRRALHFRLSGSSPRRTMARDAYAATWDEWGVVIAALFDGDHDGIVGSAARPVWRDESDFHNRTFSRFDREEHPEFAPAPGHACRWERVWPDVMTCACGGKYEPLR